MTAQRLRFPLDMPSVDPDLIALWMFSLLGDSEDLLVESLERWPSDYKPVAQA